MGFSDIFKNSFLQGYTGSDMSSAQIIFALAMTCLIGLYIFAVYRLMTRKTFYSKNFAISLVALAIITASVILTIQSSIIVSLGMVGALSIVRFRTAIKEPMDLVFLFWSISTGIICGAGLAKIAVVSAILITAALFVLDMIPVAKTPMILIVNADCGEEISDSVLAKVKEFSKLVKIKSRNITGGQIDLVIEVKVSEDEKLTDAVSRLKGVNSVSLLSHDGEVTF
ncbi:MAG: DUF4956 domain-containing protein [Lachnospiraceae bacterium]|nr:DUF4956 domain-containing protein [Lachnospiraceae bacterium]